MTDITVTTPLADELDVAFRLVFANVPEPEKSLAIESVLRQVSALKISCHGLFIAKLLAKQEAQPIGAFFAQKRLDGTVLSSPPVMLPPFSPDILFEALNQFCRENQATAAFMQIPQGEKFQKTALRKHGFDEQPDLLALAAQPHFVQQNVETRNAGCQLISAEEIDPFFDRFTLVAEKTFRKTQDYPDLLARMSVSGFLHELEHLEHHQRKNWFLLQKNGKDVGVLILTEVPEKVLELNYMGLIPETRGQGLGKELVVLALKVAAERKKHFVVTSVNEQNTPAVNCYMRAGFQIVNRSRVFIKLFEKR